MNIFIGCSSREEINNIYKDSATTLANHLIKDNNNLICGGTDGMMKIFHDIFLQNNRNVTIIEVNGYFETKTTSSYIYRYDTICERKKIITELADILLFLPGGIGTLDELFSAIESKRATEHNKSIIIININHYYDHLINQMNIMYQEQFANSNDKQYYYIVNNIEEAIQYIQKLGGEKYGKQTNEFN